MKNDSIKIYLAGGMKSGWQDRIIENEYLDNAIFYNPAKHGCNQPSEYTTWDLHHVSKCDIVFGYMEKDNPSGFGLALEIGYAKALGKTIILVDERSELDPIFERQFRIAAESATNYYRDLSDGICFLSKFHHEKTL